MQPLGRTKIRFPGKTDHHPPKGYINWWESDGHREPSKKSARQKQKREDKNLVEEYLNSPK